MGLPERPVQRPVQQPVQRFKFTKIVGFDIVELAPNPADKSSDFLAAKLYFKILTYIFEK